MVPNFYFDIGVRGARREGFGSVCVDAVTQAMARMHPIFKERADTYAIDLPGLSEGPRLGRRLGHQLRVFAQESASANAIADALDADVRLRDLVVIGRVRMVDTATHAGPWAVLRRFRVAKRSEPLNRQRDLARAANLPFLMTRSRTNGHAYTLTLYREIVQQRGSAPNGQPNSYGLSGDVPVMLPVVEAVAMPGG
ncbi:CRISPR-associated protein (Cas_Csy4) [mine drainage metagenome]|uniref:CRISPR-associated protein (Cas_Csy4) n=1 Tax=mine drainage metagenome TaxID=410659 RepID=A0A1J5RJP2_9ZZZZ